MSKLLILLSIVLLSGCSTVNYDVVKKDGSTCHASRAALFMSSDTIQGNACGGRIGATGSKTDTEALAAGIAAGMQAVKLIGGMP